MNEITVENAQERLYGAIRPVRNIALGATAVEEMLANDLESYNRAFGLKDSVGIDSKVSRGIHGADEVKLTGIHSYEDGGYLSVSVQLTRDGSPYVADDDYDRLPGWLEQINTPSKPETRFSIDEADEYTEYEVVSCKGDYPPLIVHKAAIELFEYDVNNMLDDDSAEQYGVKTVELSPEECMVIVDGLRMAEANALSVLRNMVQ